jgi:hypothetical protein
LSGNLKKQRGNGNAITETGTVPENGKTGLSNLAVPNFWIVLDENPVVIVPDFRAW